MTHWPQKEWHWSRYFDVLLYIHHSYSTDTMQGMPCIAVRNSHWHTQTIKTVFTQNSGNVNLIWDWILYWIEKMCLSTLQPNLLLSAKKYLLLSPWLTSCTCIMYYKTSIGVQLKSVQYLTSPTHLPQELLRSQEQQIVAEERLSNLEEHNKSETMQLQVHKLWPFSC